MEACHVLRTPWLPCTLIIVEQSCRYTASARTYEFSATITLSCPFASLEALLPQRSVAEFSETSVTCNVWRPPSPARQTSIAALKRAHRTNAKTACIALRSSSLGVASYVCCCQDTLHSWRGVNGAKLPLLDMEAHVEKYMVQTNSSAPWPHDHLPTRQPPVRLRFSRAGVHVA